MPLLDQELLKRTGIVGLVSGELLVCIGGGSWLGYWLDQRLKTSPLFLAVLAMIGVAYAWWRISRMARDWMK